MNRTLLSALGCSFTLLSCGITSQAQESASAAKDTAATKDTPAAGGAVTPEVEAAEAAFQTMLKEATLTGRWCLVKDGALTPEQQDSYKLKGAEKKDGKWSISASMTYAGKEISIPVPVKVEFAAGSPVIIVDKLWIPGGGTYSARVVFHDDTYAGVWSGGGMRGLLSGFITRPTAK